MLLKWKWYLVLGVAALLLLTALIVWIAWGNTALVRTEYTVKSDRLPAKFNGFRIAQVSDLHNAEIGKDNERLLTMLEEIAPDIIVLTGDLFDHRRLDADVALSFAEQALRIAPCYFVLGNHEAGIDGYEILTKALWDIGVVVLDNQAVTIEQDGEFLHVVGVRDPDFNAFELWRTDYPTIARNNLDQAGVPQGDEFVVLLAHRPDLVDIYAEYGVDLVFSGHAHGGQWRLPLVGGLYAPHQGLFPRYTQGVITKGDTRMVVSRGIGNSAFPFRLFNRPEVTVTTLETP